MGIEDHDTESWNCHIHSGKHLPDGLPHEGILFQILKAAQREGAGEERVGKLCSRGEPGAHSWGVGDSTPLLCSTCREVARSLMGWQGDAGKHPGLGDHRPWSPLLRPTSGKLEHLVFERLVTQVYVEWLL